MRFQSSLGFLFLYALSGCTDEYTPVTPIIDGSTANDGALLDGQVGDGNALDEGAAASDSADAAPDTGTNNGICELYCARVMDNCTGSNQQYMDKATCLLECALMPLGTLSDTSGNTVGCRYYHAGNTPFSTHCPHAGPSGGGMCGSRCEAFCTLATGQCKTANLDGGAPPFGDPIACMSACTWPFDGDAGLEYDPTNRNTLNCRQSHLQAAFTNPITECSNVAAVSAACSQ